MRLRSQLVVSALSVCVAASVHAGVGKNGVQMNGVQMNGVQMNGVQMNGVQMNGVQMNGVQMNGVAISGLQLVGTDFTGTIVDAQSSCAHSQLVTGAPLAGCSPCAKVVAAKDAHCATQAWDQSCVSEAQSWCTIGSKNLVGSFFHADTSDGGQRLLWLQSVQPAINPNAVWKWDPVHFRWVDSNAANNPNSDVLHYSFWALDSAKGWGPLCPSLDDDYEWNQALPVAGHWADCQGDKTRGCGGKTSNDGFTLACVDVGAIAKCVERFGYKPWKSVFEYAYPPPIFVTNPPPPPPPSHYQSLEPFHEACVRMVRGDYCGDGVPHTQDGTAINVWDHMGVETETPNLTNYLFEAEWTPHGAGCISVARFQSFGGGTSQPYPDAIAQCPSLSPVQNLNGHVVIIDGCGNYFNINPHEPFTPGYSDWTRWSYIDNQSSQLRPTTP